MTVATVTYGRIKTHQGTLAEVAASVSGYSPSIVQWMVSSNTFTAITPVLA